MVLFYSPKKQSAAASKGQAYITDLDYQGVGVAKINGKTWFIENALPGEQVTFKKLEEKRQYGIGVSEKIEQASAERQSPFCPHYLKCGGCQMQHISLEKQRATKEKALFKSLKKLQPEVQKMPLIGDDSLHYRRRLKLSIKFDPKQQQLRIGFRQKNSQEIIAIRQCPVATQAINEVLPSLLAALQQWTTPKQLGHLEIVEADNGVTVFLRHIGKMNDGDKRLLQALSATQKLHLFVQEEDSLTQLAGEHPHYYIEGKRLDFDIRDFIQVNADVNQKMVATALQWLAPQKEDRILDLFCGIGNFTLPLSQNARYVVGVEGVENMVRQAQQNAQQNQCDNLQFYPADLTQPFADQPWAKEKFNKVLLDPARSGAAFALPHLASLHAEKILYVSCNPATLVRDCEILLQLGYVLKQTAMIDMFPHTGHLESISLFELK
ncbi:23S rRNA (uracil(1939)-C(5))-methyltransferase RlmD [[Haemophilus] felis]|uniref:23S rRNA (uracil(1939)-C(5))-methyltransferase RlmD n=1 Tax=[Haemophilus] felis TaxID=123822 RepID=A0A1T0AZI7_9PAST|nr:23S rRNA (uracil(1939)-C(5))-methyltransferase RlmD [[Haemophilus] felis]NBI40671.1 23S rRNA (uracil(1939)-C(5))-methyltransferase RlmD [[Haemophilus] felis]OOS03232.1 23S rRNA methyltransferase [[Haemophilus] felis]